MKTMKSLLITGLLALLAGCAATVDSLRDEGFVQMTGAEIEAALVGNSLDGFDRDGEYVIHYPAADTMRIEYRGRREAGVWRIDGDQYCRRWETFGNGRERCVTMYRQGDRIDWVQNGRVTDRSVLVEGNPAAL